MVRSWARSSFGIGVAAFLRSGVFFGDRSGLSCRARLELDGFLMGENRPTLILAFALRELRSPRNAARFEPPLDSPSANDLLHKSFSVRDVLVNRSRQKSARLE